MHLNHYIPILNTLYKQQIPQQNFQTNTLSTGALAYNLVKNQKETFIT